MNADEIISAARECLDTPFKHQGRLVGRALDCAGVIVHVARHFGFEPIQPSGYSRTPMNGLIELFADAQPYLKRVDINDQQAGDILMMRFSREPQHVGIFTGENIIHAYEKMGKVCEHRLSSVWAARIVRVYRFVEVSQ